MPRQNPKKAHQPAAYEERAPPVNGDEVAAQEDAERGAEPEP